ncbi:hypothetical protein DM01DRAFT_323991 [Hesseltinella vesiculosa]|uniref:Uncharacterized protein n=1 Tax=Hesseltinella vesiculosa TaxID=101127 RepID=A0A1X2GPG9_9FUNG|nr:hypothetical protein DM01DRAFT_323991 [Hesseltinella vesiculosa]
MILVVTFQTLATILLVTIFLIVPSLQFYGGCTLTLTNLGYAQWDLVGMGQLMANSFWLGVLCLDALFHVHTMALYAVLFFGFWSVVASSVQVYQHDVLMQVLANDCTSNPMDGAASMIGYSVAGVSFLGWVGLVVLAICHRQRFQAPLNPTTSASVHLIKLDFYWVFSHSMVLLPLNLLESAITAYVETRIDPVRRRTALALLATVISVCAVAFGYVGYQLIRFAMTSDFDHMRYRLMFMSLTLLLTLLLTVSVLIASFVLHWKKPVVLLDKQKAPNDTDTVQLFLTPTNSVHAQ